MTSKKNKLVLKVPYKTGWILISNDTMEIKAHAKKFSDIVTKANVFDPNKHSILAAAESYHNHLMLIVKVKHS
ncbi:hypothetical protein A3H89_05375 [Candidatus Amesbacteria bacterium RIFCSPLOWO2_02_FULL_48_11]|nr:MAG: hypothetical protein A2354_04250 [Candidatus Amesbacteria bacterium RIFOXYB1_FULL_47_12]OGD02198.1 MAG: hypothetical protein A3E17_00700 [Candidatus Amesbacteria bacterium RIFCSPHIGHO2_12_FULL_48_14]OGD06649.1 MAG: hypothetical protein A3H89_05375 [Candidatus Amesbacteria bacterium RIFCSPLOWO2_02_FULL_48_11]OGD10987.1 MAG: hypothetical protein A2576_02295 [Candidatus Amesbacteria bacterium RIFOXYD1_FULL_47_9]